MGTGAIVVFLVLVLAFAVTARALGRIDVTAPMAFVVAGALLSLGLPDLGEKAHEALTLLTELTLALILFHDAAQVRPRQITADRGLMARLLLVGLPLTIAAGWLLGSVVFPGMPALMLLLLAASVAPTDAGLGAATVLNPVVPVRVRRMLNVESGLNDGLCTPFVLFAIAALAGEGGSLPSRASRRGQRPRRGHPGRCGHRRRGRHPARLVAHPRVAARGTPAPSPSSFFPSSPTSRPSWQEATPSWRPSWPGPPSPGPPVARGRGVRARPHRGAGRPARLRGVVRLRLHRRAAARGARRLGRGGLRAARPDPAADGARGPRAARHRSAAPDRRLRRLVRAPRPGLDRSSPCSPRKGSTLDPDLDPGNRGICLTVLLSVLAHGLSADPLARRCARG